MLPIPTLLLTFAGLITANSFGGWQNVSSSEEALPVENLSNYLSNDAATQDMPLIKLPYGTWRATTYDPRTDIYVFKNIRYAAPPVGNLRWAKPAPPQNNATIQDGKYGYSCFQSVPPSALALAGVTGIPFIQKILGTGALGSIINMLPTKTLPNTIDGIGSLLNGSPSLARAFISIISRFDVGLLTGSLPSGEDCLFLDIFVPGKALKSKTKLSVVNYIYGGAYVLGTKEPIYDAQPIVEQSRGNIIAVVGNYRLSGLGFLAGSTFQEEGGTPNVGFWDQRAIMQWIQNYIPLVNGDPTQVTLWGESAGAGSVMHHLTATGGTLKPLFKRAFVQSPWNVPKYNSKGNLEKQYRELANQIGCTTGNLLTCMRAVKAEPLRKAIDKLVAEVPYGQFGFGATVDGTFVKQLPALELAAGNFVKDIESVIVTHNSDEASMFVPDVVNTKEQAGSFEKEITSLYGGHPEVLEAILARYPLSKYKNDQARIIDYMSPSYFVCNALNLANAYKDKVWLGQWSRLTGKHGTDIRVIFFNATAGAPKDDPPLLQLAPEYRSYFLSHVQTGDVNKLKAKGIIDWPKPTISKTFGNVMDANNELRIIEDKQLDNEVCDFWLDIWKKVSLPAK